MIASLTGIIQDISVQHIIIDVAGVGYQVFMPQLDVDAIKPIIGDKISVYIYHHIRENNQTLYGFSSLAAKNMFLLLIQKVSGIGPATALAILGSMTSDEFKEAVVSENYQTLSQAKGLGKRTAERIILELKDKVGVVATWKEEQLGENSGFGDAQLALLSLGYKQNLIQKVLRDLKKADSSGEPQEIIKKALQLLNKL